MSRRKVTITRTYEVDPAWTGTDTDERAEQLVKEDFNSFAIEEIFTEEAPE